MNHRGHEDESTLEQDAARDARAAHRRATLSVRFMPLSEHGLATDMIDLSPAERFVAVWKCSRNAYAFAGVGDPDAPMRRDMVTVRLGAR